MANHRDDFAFMCAAEKMTLFIGLGVLLGFAFFLIEAVDEAAYNAWCRESAPPKPKIWWIASTTGAFTLIAATGLLLLVRQQLSLLDPLDIAMILNFGLAAVSVVWTRDRRHTVFKTGRWLAVGCATFGIGLTGSIAECAAVVALGSAVFVLGGLVDEVRTAASSWTTGYRFRGVIGANKQGIQCAILAFSLVFLYQSGHLPFAGTAFAVAICCVILLWTRSRTTFWAAVAAAVIWIYLCVPEQWRPAYSMALAGLGLAVAVMAINPSARRRIVSAILLGRSGSEWRILSGRLPIWIRIWDAIRERPWLGYGYWSFWTDARRQAFLRHLPFPEPIRHAHSLYLEVLLNGGLIGLLLFTITLGLAWDAAGAAPPPAGPFIVALLVFVTTHGVFESMFVLPFFRTLGIMSFLVALHG